MDHPNIKGKVVVITGASSGLGEATARHLGAFGAVVVLGARRGMSQPRDVGINEILFRPTRQAL